MANVHRRRRRSAPEILIRADKLQAKAEEPGNRDDPAWLLRRAEQMRRYAVRRQKARTRKAEERRKNT
jgi:hypothetical protein